MPDFLLVLLLALSCAVQLIFIFFFFLPLSRKRYDRQIQHQVELPAVSVVICARNELIHLQQNLETVLKQRYPNFEVVVVDDHSNDGTSTFLETLSRQYTYLRIISCNDQPKLHKGKKEALEVGVKEAANDLLLLSDADCRPASHLWIEHMAKAFTNKKDFVLGFSPVVPEKGFLNKLVRFDVWMIGLQYLGFAAVGLPYMGTGRNLMYRKSLREREINRHLDLISGDDDLFVNQLARQGNTGICIAPEAHVLTWAPSTFGRYFYQKKRHLTTGIRYQNLHKVLLSLYTFSKLLMYALFVFLFTFSEAPIEAVYLLLTYWITFGIVAWRLRYHLQSGGLTLLIPILDGVSVFFNSFVFASTIFGNTTRWK
jgi:cellulose synthase/poly-beta-1,6-N-acetylglucosamine synthase-like glycosyltransferase